LIESWEIDLATFGLDIVLNHRPARGRSKKFELVERESDHPGAKEPGLVKFLQNPALSADATRAEIDFPRSLRFRHQRPMPLYYYRELQNLRDPLHFRPAEDRTA
jgi:hypothetical protein